MLPLKIFTKNEIKLIKEYLSKKKKKRVKLYKEWQFLRLFTVNKFVRQLSNQLCH